MGKTKKSSPKARKASRRRRSPTRGVQHFNNPFQNTYPEEPTLSFYDTQIPANRRNRAVNVINPYIYDPNVPHTQPPTHVVRDLTNIGYTEEEIEDIFRTPSPPHYINNTSLYRQYNDDRDDNFYDLARYNYNRGGRSKKYSRRNRRK
jgi:hypothetical protein